MQFSNPSKLHTLFWEIKNRSVYILFSFFFSFTIAYQNCKPLLYLFVLPYTNINKISAECVHGLHLLLYFDQDDRSISSDNWKQAYLQWNTNNLDTIRESPLLFTQYTRLDLVNFSELLKSIDISSIHFIFTDVEEAFSSTILVCLIFSFISIIPILLYQGFCFFSSSLYLHENRKWIFRLSGIFSIWCYFSYNVQTFFIPKLTQFLLKFQISSLGFNLLAETKINSYCSWASSIFLVTNFVFFFICLFLFLIISKQLKIENVARRRKTSAIILLLVSALIAPPELIQIFLALIFFFCFELFIYFFFVYKQFIAKKFL